MCRKNFIEHLSYLCYECEESEEDVVKCKSGTGLISLLIFRPFGEVFYTGYSVSDRADKNSVIRECNLINIKMISSKIYYLEEDNAIIHESTFIGKEYNKNIFSNFLASYNSDSGIIYNSDIASMIDGD